MEAVGCALDLLAQLDGGGAAEAGDAAAPVQLRLPLLLLEVLHLQAAEVVVCILTCHCRCNMDIGEEDSSSCVVLGVMSWMCTVVHLLRFLTQLTRDLR